MGVAIKNKWAVIHDPYGFRLLLMEKNNAVVGLKNLDHSLDELYHFITFLLKFGLFTDKLDQSNCGSLEQLNTKTTIPTSFEETKTMDCLTRVVGSEHLLFVLLEFAADNDVECFQRSMTISDVSLVGGVGLWYGRRKCSKHIVVEHRTPLMIAAKHGSVDFVKLILSLSEVDVNLFCGPDKGIVFHCAAFSGSIRVMEVVRLFFTCWC